MSLRAVPGTLHARTRALSDVGLYALGLLACSWAQWAYVPPAGTTVVEPQADDSVTLRFGPPADWVFPVTFEDDGIDEWREQG